MTDAMTDHDGNTWNLMAESLLAAPPDPRLSPLAVAYFKKSLEVDAGNVETWLGLAKAYRRIGRLEPAHDCCDRALAIEPHSIKALLYRCMLQIPILYERLEEIQDCREQYHRHLLSLVEAVDPDDAEAVGRAADAVGAIQPFRLPFQALNDTELQRLYGAFAHRVLTARYPRWRQPPPMAPPGSGERIRVGVVFGHFRSHSVWKVIVKGWVGMLDRSRFALHGYALDSPRDSETDYARACFERFVEGPLTFEQWCAEIRSDRPQVLIYPEIGMHRLAAKLAGLRLAPVQCASWGHSVTTGLPTMDYFLSSELIEPHDAEAHYTEKLIRLPNLSIYYEPAAVTPADKPREAFGLRESALVYFCAQSLFKCLPQFDDIYPRIVKDVGDCQIVFLKDKKSEPITRQFQQRMEKTFRSHGLDMGHHGVLLPRLSTEEYHAINRLADVYLDTIGWSGGTTTLEAIAYNLPVVTLPGEYFRGRMSYGILKRMGVTETVAGTVDQYVAVAVRLGRDRAWRQQVRERMRSNKWRVYRDMECIEGLGKFLSGLFTADAAGGATSD